MTTTTISKLMERDKNMTENKGIYFCLFFAFLLVGLSFVVTPYMLAASLAYFMMIGGLLVRKWSDKTLHARLMTTAILLDISIVLILELQRSAIDTAVSLNLSPLQMAHIGTSSIATLLYFPVLILGLLLWRKKSTTPKMRTWHLRLAIPAFVFRTLGFILMLL